MKPPKVTFKDCWRQFAEVEDRPEPPSQQYLKMKSCSSKVAHVTMALAEKAVEKANQTGTGEYNAYYCRWCHLYHVGHKPGTVKIYAPLRPRR